MLNPIEEAKFQELKDKCRELKVPTLPEIFIGLKVHDHNGVLTFDDIQRGHSWTRNFYNSTAMVLLPAAEQTTTAGAGSLTRKTQDNGLVTNAAGYNSPTVGSIGSTYQGIVVGTSDMAFSVANYKLEALIEHGVTSGKFSYAAGILGTASYNAGAKTWTQTLSRIMNNNSGGSITVKEVGLKSAWAWGNGELFERSILNPEVVVANGAQLTVTYTTSMDFSAID